MIRQGHDIGKNGDNFITKYVKFLGKQNFI